MNEKQPLLQSRTSRHKRHKIFNSCCVPYKGAVLVLVWSSLLHTLGMYVLSSSWFQNAALLCSINVKSFFILLLASMIMILLLYPIAGLLAETLVTRYKVMLLGNVLVSVSLLILLGSIASVAYVYFLNEDWVESLNQVKHQVPIFVGFFIHQFGLALFEANAIQFGVDQLQFANNDELSKFVHWYFWTLFAVQYTLVSIDSIIDFPLLWIFPQTFLSLVCSIFIIFIMYRCRQSLFTEPVGITNPIKHILKVLMYVWKHKYPVRRSAFTYGEDPPSRLDLAKERYGGPFTTEQVEDVKTFWRIILILISLFGFLTATGSLATSSDAYYDYCPPTNVSFDYQIDDEIFFSTSVDGYLYLIIILGIPIYMLLFRPYLHRYLPRMLTKMGLGLMIVCLCLTCITIYNVFSFRNYQELGIQCLSNYTDSTLRVDQTVRNIEIALLLTAQILHGLSYLLVFLTALEFILAQAPRNMQGFLIGLWYAYQSLGIGVRLVTVLTLKGTHCHYWPYTVKTGLAIISLTLYVFVSYTYKYRQREEPSNVNRQRIIEEYTERQLIQENIHKLHYSSDMDSSITSNINT